MIQKKIIFGVLIVLLMLNVNVTSSNLYYVTEFIENNVSYYKAVYNNYEMITNKFTVCEWNKSNDNFRTCFHNFSIKSDNNNFKLKYKHFKDIAIFENSEKVNLNKIYLKSESFDFTIIDKINLNKELKNITIEQNKLYRFQIKFKYYGFNNDEWNLTFLSENNINITIDPFISICSNLVNENETYYLTANIIDVTTTCMAFLNHNITLDCQNYWINGSGSGVGIGIFSNVKKQPTIKNCRLGNGLSYGLYIGTAHNISIYNNFIQYHKLDGIYLKYSDNITSYNNTVCYCNRTDMFINVSGFNFISYNNTCRNSYNFNDSFAIAGVQGCMYNCNLKYYTFEEDLIQCQNDLNDCENDLDDCENDLINCNNNITFLNNTLNESLENLSDCLNNITFLNNTLNESLENLSDCLNSYNSSNISFYECLSNLSVLNDSYIECLNNNSILNVSLENCQNNFTLCNQSLEYFTNLSIELNVSYIDALLNLSICQTNLTNCENNLSLFSIPSVSEEIQNAVFYVVIIIFTLLIIYYFIRLATRKKF